MASSQIKFPDQHYIGMIATRNSTGEGMDVLPLAFMTPDGTDSTATKRKDTVDRWVTSNNSRNSNVLPTATLKNEPMGGFRLLDDVRRYSGWGSGNVKWRVEDPRGFELEISSPNLMQILSCSVVDCGEILDKCIWAREGSENILVPVTSETYTITVANTERMNKSVSLKDLKLGDNVILQNGTKGRYCGKLSLIEIDHGDYFHNDYGIKVTDKKKFIFVDGDSAHTVTAPKLSEITKSEPLTIEEGLRLANGVKKRNCLAFTLDHMVTLQRLRQSAEILEDRQLMIIEFRGEVWTIKAKGMATGICFLEKLKSSEWEENNKIIYKSLPGNWNRCNSIRIEVTDAEIKGSPLWKRHRQIILSNSDVVAID